MLNKKIAAAVAVLLLAQTGAAHAVEVTLRASVPAVASVSVSSEFVASNIVNATTSAVAATAATFTAATGPGMTFFSNTSGTTVTVRSQGGAVLRNIAAAPNGFSNMIAYTSVTLRDLTGFDGTAATSFGKQTITAQADAAAKLGYMANAAVRAIILEGMSSTAPLVAGSYTDTLQVTVTAA